MQRITPSRPDYWVGGRVEGARFTVQQERALAARGVDENTVKTFEVSVRLRQNSSLDPMWAKHLCPVLRTTNSGRLIIAPNGMERWVDRVGPNA